MSLSEIIEEMDQMSPDELKIIQDKLNELYSEDSTSETPEMLAAIDEGLRSLRDEGTIPLEDVIAEIKTWNTKSS